MGRRRKPQSAFDVMQTVLSTGGKALGLVGEAIGDDDLRDVGDLVQGAASVVPDVRKDLHDKLTDKGREVGKRIFDVFDGVILDGEENK